jgi:hypothetical protein
MGIYVHVKAAIIALAILVFGSQLAYAQGPENRMVFFGETHLHTVLSFDAYIFGNRNGPDEAYRYAKGEAISHPAGFEMKLDRPLDFQAVTDHAIYLGMLPAMHDPKMEASKHPISLELRKAKTPSDRLLGFQKIFALLQPGVEDDLLDVDIVKSTWADVIESAQKHYEPGKFTTFIAYEYTSGPDNQNLHRNVFFRGDKAPSIPFSRLISSNPEDLWDWMDENRSAGMDSLAIPHNSNGSNGQMFKTETFTGKPFDTAYVAQRLRNEPIIEVTQVKGDSETHPMLSPNDEWADFETMPYRIGTWNPSNVKGSYIREAYLNGLMLEKDGIENPFKFGLIGASDTHVGAGAFTEGNYWSKVGVVDSDGKLRGSVPLDKPLENGSPYTDNNFQTWSASGLAAIWAEENTREALFDAMRRKETYATTGPRIKLRFFASADYDASMINAPDLSKQAYAKGVTMGSDLMLKDGQVPKFILWAIRDPYSTTLQRLQVVKGWVDASGKAQETVYDVACAGGVGVDFKTNRCPENNATVDLKTCKSSAPTGENELKVMWEDPSYSADEKAFYYVRVLENPTCRWSTWDAIRAGVAPRKDIASTIQERAYSSPIWIN